MADDGDDWLTPTHDLGIYPFPSRRLGVDYQLSIALWAYRMQVSRLRWMLAHPEIPVSGFGPLPLPPRPPGHNKRARAAREAIAAEHLDRVRREHVRRLVVVFWPRFQLIASWIEARSEHARRTQARAEHHLGVA